MSSNQPARIKDADSTPRLTLCLAMDLNGSTASGLRLSTRKLDRFNIALVDQFAPHLEAMELEDTVVKFTGDGWLVVSENQEHAANLCCLAVVMACNFQHELAKEVSLPPESIPTLRLAVCWGRDLRVTLPNGFRDYVGSSVRRAVRACQLCGENEILIDETVRTWVNHDFRTTLLNLEQRMERFPTAKLEEEPVLYTLEEMKLESATESDAPVCFVNALSIIGRVGEADSLANRISEGLVAEAASAQVDDPTLLSRWNHLLAANLDDKTVREMLDKLIKAGLQPDVHTYNALIEKSGDYRSQSHWLQVMIQRGIAPSVDTFNAMLKSAKSEAETRRRLTRMENAGVSPDSATLDILVSKANDFATANDWIDGLAAKGVQVSGTAYEKLLELAESFAVASAVLEKMIAVGHQPSDTAFIALFAKDLSEVRADDLLKWYLGLRYHPTHPIKRAIAEYRRKGLIDDALRLTLDYPHTDTSLKTIRQFPDRALQYYRSIVESRPDHANGAYALGMALVETGQPTEAETWLRKAYQLATPGTRKDELARYISLLERVVVASP